MKVFKKGELFCGPGGLAEGAKDLVIGHNGKSYTIEHAWANDIDADSCKTFSQYICKDRDETVYCEDVDVFIDRAIAFAENQDTKINALTFGFPCNDYSIVGEQKGIHGKYGPLYKYGVEILKTHKPDWFLAENVGGLKSANGGKTFTTILEELANAGPGYDIVPHLYKFEDYGIPQRRHRIIIVGIRKDLNLKYEVPAPEYNYRTAKDALENPQIPLDAANQEPTKHSSRVIGMLQCLQPGENAWSESVPEHLRLNVKGAKLSQIYKRLEPDKPAYTVTGSGGGGTHVYHWSEPRALTNRERARLQTFDDNHVFYGSKESARKQIGMAVPPQGARIIFTAILNTFAGKKYPSIKPSWNIDDLI